MARVLTPAGVGAEIYATVGLSDDYVDRFVR